MSAIRTAATLSDAEVRESARRRVAALAARHGADSPQVHAALARWGRVLDDRTAGDDLMALMDAIGGDAS